MHPDHFIQALHGWQSFYSLLGASSATLTGLMFVAASLGTHLINDGADPKVRTYITPTVIYFSLVLLISALMNVPVQTRAALTVELGAVGLIGAGYSVSHLRRLRGFHHDSALRIQDWLWNLGLPLLAALCLIVAAFFLLRSVFGGLNTAAVSVLLLVMVGIHNAWNATLYVIGRTPA